MLKVAVICNCSTENNNYYFTPSYLKNMGGYPHDLIIVHRNFLCINKDVLKNEEGKLIYINKILDDKTEVPHKGYGSYKYVFDKFKEEYDIFVFMQETCVIRRNLWIKDAIKILTFSEHIGFCASQIFNGNDLNDNSTKYPHETHMRAPGPLFIKTKFLKQITWDFNSDHEGEMITGELLSTQTDCIGIQIGNKINFAYDTLGTPPLINIESAKSRSNYNHITQLLENIFFADKNGIDNFNEDEYLYFEKLYSQYNDMQRNLATITPPFDHIPILNIFYDIQPFNNLIYGKTVIRAQEKLGKNISKINNMYILNMDNLDSKIQDISGIQTYIKYNCSSCLEIGGPTLLFTSCYPYHIYNLFNEIDNFNLYNLKDSFISIKSSNDNNIYNNMYTELSQINKKYDILISSHCIEHMANPIKTLNMYKTLLKDTSYILTILPNKSEFWDSIRPTTTMKHLIQDYISNIEENDNTHEEENLAVAHPYKINCNHPDKPNNISYEEMIKNNVNYRLMHHHCFDLQLCIDFHEYLNFETMACFVPSDDKLQIIYFGRKKTN